MAPIGVPVVYAVELSIPAMYFRRSLISSYAIFFFSFHLIAWSLQACFFGLFFIWIAVIPVSRLLEPLEIEGEGSSRTMKILRRCNWFGLLHFASPQSSEAGLPRSFAERSLASGTQFCDLLAVRRAM